MKKKEIKIVYEKSDDYFDTYITGIYGGLTPMDTLKVYLFEETFTFPKRETSKITEDGKIGPIKKEIDDDLKRIVKGSIVIPMSELPAIIKWLQSKLDDYNKRKSGEK